MMSLTWTNSLAAFLTNMPFLPAQRQTTKVNKHDAYLNSGNIMLLAAEEKPAIRHEATGASCT